MSLWGKCSSWTPTLERGVCLQGLHLIIESRETEDRQSTEEPSGICQSKDLPTVTGQVTVSPTLHMPGVRRHRLDSARTAIRKWKYIKPRADLSEWYMVLDIPSGIWSLPMAFAQKSQFITTWGTPPPSSSELWTRSRGKGGWEGLGLTQIYYWCYI